MSDLRDARLRKALDAAPDAQLRPDARTRQAIHERARATAASGGARHWWNRFWSGASRPRMPWNAAFATIVLASLVTVLWHEREVPDAGTERRQNESQAPAAGSARPSAPAPDQRSAAAAAPPTVSAPATDAGQARQSTRASPQSRADSVRKAPPPSQAPRGRRDDSAVLSDRQAGDLAKSAPRQDERRRSEGTSAAPPLEPAPAPAPAAPAEAAPATPAPAPAARIPAPAAGLASQSQRSAIDTATHLRIANRGRIVDAPLEHPSALADLIGRVARDARGAEPFTAPAELRVELLREGRLAGVLELAGPQVRWTQPRGTESDSGTARPEPALLQALRVELNRLLER
jgi:hypothetical protein